jgi:hypothetical protein
VSLLIEFTDRHKLWIYSAKGLDGLGIGKLPALNSAGLIQTIEATEVTAIVGFNVERAMLDAGMRSFHMRLLLKGSRAVISVSAMTQFLSSMRGGQDRHRVLRARCRSAFYGRILLAVQRKSHRGMDYSQFYCRHSQKAQAHRCPKKAYRARTR